MADASRIMKPLITSRNMPSVMMLSGKVTIFRSSPDGCVQETDDHGSE